MPLCSIYKKGSSEFADELASMSSSHQGFQLQGKENTCEQRGAF